MLPDKVGFGLLDALSVHRLPDFELNTHAFARIRQLFRMPEVLLDRLTLLLVENRLGEVPVGKRDRGRACAAISYGEHVGTAG